jgi:ABC-type multidrug transport system ATPase subunit
MTNKPILKNLTGRISPGNFTAIIGPSGSGKTTLMNFLSGRLFSSNLEITGAVKINGE